MKAIFACRPRLACLWLVVVFFAAAQLVLAHVHLIRQSPGPSDTISLAQRDV
ncbi:hypothetical protein IHE33_12405 (plasmid) [Mycetohabitans endofungorum]|uniref:hypothetical protein n=1 Tax=Mycetohabitans endofungorum TaxID=417203 RepID=UPI0030D4F478